MTTQISTIYERYNLPTPPTRQELLILLGYDNLFCFEAMGYQIIELVDYNGSVEFITTRRGHYEEPVRYTLTDVIEIAYGLGCAPLSRFDLVIDSEPIPAPRQAPQWLERYSDYVETNAGILALVFMAAFAFVNLISKF